MRCLWIFKVSFLPVHVLACLNVFKSWPHVSVVWKALSKGSSSLREAAAITAPQSCSSEEASKSKPRGTSREQHWVSCAISGSSCFYHKKSISLSLPFHILPALWSCKLHKTCPKQSRDRDLEGSDKIASQIGMRKVQGANIIQRTFRHNLVLEFQSKTWSPSLYFHKYISGISKSIIPNEDKWRLGPECSHRCKDWILDFWTWKMTSPLENMEAKCFDFFDINNSVLKCNR